MEESEPPVEFIEEGPPKGSDERTRIMLKEQQERIEQQQRIIEQQQEKIEEILKKL